MVKDVLKDLEKKMKASLDRFRKELDSEYFDILLLHCVRAPDWAEQHERLRHAAGQREALAREPRTQAIRRHGVPDRSTAARRRCAHRTPWLR